MYVWISDPWSYIRKTKFAGNDQGSDVQTYARPNARAEASFLNGMPKPTPSARAFGMFGHQIRGHYRQMLILINLI